MLIQGISVLAVLAAILSLAALVLAFLGVRDADAVLVQAAVVLAVCGVTAAVLSTVDDE